MTASLELRIDHHPDGDALIWTRSDGTGADTQLLALAAPLVLETSRPGQSEPTGRRHEMRYRTCRVSPTGMIGETELEADGVRYALQDVWTRTDALTWTVERTLHLLSGAPGAGFRMLLELAPTLPDADFSRFRYFAPPALYDLNDLNQDGVEDYLDTRVLHFRDDRLNARTLLAFHEASGFGFALSRLDRPEFDPLPDRMRGQVAFLQRTDIGSIGVEPRKDTRGGIVLTASYPFVERDRSHALLVRERVAWGAFWPAEPGLVACAYQVRFIEAPTVHDGLWSVWTNRIRELQPTPVELPVPLDEITSLRLDALLRYHIEETQAPFAAGFVTNCHPQDGSQLSNVIQYGFTGQNVLNAYNLLRARPTPDGAERRRKALRVIDFFVEVTAGSPNGLSYGLYNADSHAFGSWWTGLLLPLAYARPGHDLETLMGPVYGHLRHVIDALRGRDGTYLRCAAEEFDALLEAYRHEQAAGIEHETWREACLKFGRFLVSAQEPDGSWFRAYSFVGEPITDPADWFGQTMFQRKSSTAVVIPFLVALHELTGERAWLDAAERAGRFVRENFVDRIKFNGGIHDSIYARPQLVDMESIFFPFRALLRLYQATGDAGFRLGAIRAARLLATWTCLWDVPLPEQSTLARFGFRSTGWTACDTAGAGYIHPMGLLMVPDLVTIGLETQDEAILTVAKLIQAGCNENVATPAKDWGYAVPGLQEEGLLISWWLADDPMFTDTAFGGRGKGEGNKTCLPWISAVGVYGHQEMLARFGTTDIEELASRQRSGGLPG